VAERTDLERQIFTAEEMIDAACRDEAERAQLREELASGSPEAWQEERSQVAFELASVNEHHDELVTMHSEAARRREELLHTDAIAALELERSTLRAELTSALDRWAVLSVAGQLLDQTLTRYERERQPEVINRAGELFTAVTDGRYVKVVTREDADGKRRGIEVISASGGRIDSGDLSRGTAEQLYLCLRLALAQNYAKGAVALPLVLDDVLVNFDAERSTAVARAVAETARHHQVLTFTCHRHIVELMRTVDPRVQVIELGESAVSASLAV
jgi:uncharacterized protein YhaN